jgi:hypothetical protein
MLAPYKVVFAEQATSLPRKRSYSEGGQRTAEVWFNEGEAGQAG